MGLARTDFFANFRRMTGRRFKTLLQHGELKSLTSSEPQPKSAPREGVMSCVIGVRPGKALLGGQQQV